MSNKLPPVIILLGATAVGKTALSLQLAEALGAEIISVDSRLFYKGMDIGTAKPKPQELARVPHHFINIVNPDEVWSLGKFKKAVRKTIAEIHARGRLPLCVGGTGQYIQAIAEGWSIPEIGEDLALRDALLKWVEQIGKEGLHARLASLDPLAAKKIDPRNLRRTVRAVEVILRTGRRFSSQRQKDPLPYRVLKIGLARPREELYARVAQRVEAMMAAGFLEEVQTLLNTYPPDLRSFSAIGYQQLIAHLNGELSLDEAVTEIIQKTRLFVRRQNTWFKPDDPQIAWFAMNGESAVSIEALIRDFVNS